MRTEDNEMQGTTVVLTAGDRLDDVPESHQALITEDIQAVFADPFSYFDELAKRCPFHQMREWIRAGLKERNWELQLHRGWCDIALTGFEWQSESVRSAILELPRSCDLTEFPEELQEFWSLVGIVHWNGFGCSGGLGACADETRNTGDILMPLSCFDGNWTGATFDPDEAFSWGRSPCGDLVICLNDGRGGWAYLGDHKVHLLGSIGDTINHIFRRLIENRCPEWEREWY